MDSQAYKEAIDYELLTQMVYKEILAKEGVNTIDVQHNASLSGRSGVDHQIDIYWEFKQAGITHRVLIECKNYASNLTLEKARNFFAVLHDIGNCNGIMVTKTGYQSGVMTFCKYYGIALKLLRKPTNKDWEGRIKTIHIRITPRAPVSDEAHPITEEMRWWIPSQLNVLEQEDGGPYKKKVELNEHYIADDIGRGIELIQVIGVTLEYYVETKASKEVVIDAMETVEAILKDFESGEWEHVHSSS